MGVRIKWLGHASFQVVTDSGRHIYLDPWIRENPVCPIKMDDITRADIVCATHGHPDHLGESIEIIKKTKGILICSPEIGVFAQNKGIPYDGENSYPMNIGGSVKIDGIEVVMTNAVHTSDTWEEGRLVTGSGACGYIIVTDEDVRIYFAGDTGLFGDMELIGQLYAPQIAMLPVGGKYNMGSREAAFAAHLIRADVLIPMHYGTFPNQTANLEELQNYLRVLAPMTRVKALKVGEVLRYPA